MNRRDAFKVAAAAIAGAALPVVASPCIIASEDWNWKPCNDIHPDAPFTMTHVQCEHDAFGNITLVTMLPGCQILDRHGRVISGNDGWEGYVSDWQIGEAA